MMTHNIWLLLFDVYIIYRNININAQFVLNEKFGVKICAAAVKCILFYENVQMFKMFI